MKLTGVISDDYDFSRQEEYLADMDYRVDVAAVVAEVRRASPGVFK